MTTLRSPDLAPAHPGALVAEIVENQEKSRTAIAEAIGVTRLALYNVMETRSSISARMAVGIERALGVSADLLVNMQAAYDLWQARQAERANEAKPARHGGPMLYRHEAFAAKKAAPAVHRKASRPRKS